METAIIVSTLEKENVTEAVLSNLRTNYLGLTINGVEDKEGLKAAKAAAKECQGLRTLTVRICKAGREEANAVSKAWIEKEKEVVKEISEVESHLDTQIEAIEEAIKAAEFEAEQRVYLPARIEKLATLGVTADEALLLKMSPAQFTEYFNELHSKALEKKQAEQDAKDRAQKEETERQEKERLAIAAQRSKARVQALNALGMKASGFDYVYGSVRVTDGDIEAMTAEAWDSMLANITPTVEALIAEDKRLADKKIEDDKAAAAEQARLGEIERQRKEQERKDEEARLEKERLAKEAAAAPDNEKLLAYGKALLAVEVPEVETEEAKKALEFVLGQLQKAVMVFKK